MIHRLKSTEILNPLKTDSSSLRPQEIETMQELELKHFTYRELLAQKSMAERAIKRGKNPEMATKIVSRIDQELQSRRDIKFENAHKRSMDLGGLIRKV